MGGFHAPLFLLGIAALTGTPPTPPPTPEPSQSGPFIGDFYGRMQPSAQQQMRPLKPLPPTLDDEELLFLTALAESIVRDD